MVPLVLGVLVCWAVDLGQAKAPSQYAAVLRKFGGPEHFTCEDYWPIPEDFNDDECWLLVKASAVYPWDKYARFNNGSRPKLEAPAVIGQEVSGIVIQCGKNVTHVEQAGRVFAKMANFTDGYKQIVLVKGKDTFPLPENFTHEEGCVSYYPFVVAHKALFHRANISRGKSILITGANRDVGLAAVQIAKAYGMYPIVATVGTEEAMHFVKEIGGADNVIDHSKVGYRARVQIVNEHRKYDVILNAKYPSEPYFGSDFAKDNGGVVLYHDGRNVETETLDAENKQHYRKLTPEEVNASITHVLDGLHNGVYRPHINRTFYLDQIDEAHRLVDNEEVLGDVVLTKVHRDNYIHLTNCENRASGLPLYRPVTYINDDPLNCTPPTHKIFNYRFNFTPANSAEHTSISNYIWSLAIEELYGGTTPTDSPEMATYTFESLYSSRELSLSSDSFESEAKDVYDVLDKKGNLLEPNKTRKSNRKKVNKTEQAELRRRKLMEGVKRRRKREVGLVKLLW